MPLVAALVAVGFICSARPAAESRRGSAERQKARFFYMEGMAHDALDDNDAAYELFRRAYQSDPSYAPAAYDYGAVLFKERELPYCLTRFEGDDKVCLTLSDKRSVYAVSDLYMRKY